MIFSYQSGDIEEIYNMELCYNLNPWTFNSVPQEANYSCSDIDILPCNCINTAHFINTQGHSAKE